MCLRPPLNLRRKTSTIWDEGALHETTSIFRLRETCYVNLSQRKMLNFELSTCDDCFGSNDEISQSRCPLGVNTGSTARDVATWAEATILAFNPTDEERTYECERHGM